MIKPIFLDDSVYEKWMLAILLMFYTVFAYPIEIIFKGFILYSDILCLIVIMLSFNKISFKVGSILIVFMLIVITILSNFFADNFNLYQVVRQLRFILFGFFLFSIAKRNASIDAYNLINKTIVICSYLSFLWLLRQYFWGWTSFEEIWIIETLNSQPELSYIGTTRFFATFPYANTASLFFAIAFLISIDNMKKSLVFKIGMVVSALGLVLVQMKIGYFVGILIMVLYFRKIKIMYFLTLMVLLSTSLMFMENKYFVYTLEKLDNPLLFLSAFEARLSQVEEGFVVFLESPYMLFIGAGLGASNLVTYIDNLYFTMLYQNGIVFFSIVVTIAIRFYLFTYKKINNEKQCFNGFILIILLYSFTSNVLNNSIIFYIFILYMGLFSGLKDRNPV